MRGSIPMIRNLDLQKKLFLYFSAITAIILLVSGFAFINYNTTILKENIETSSMESLVAIQNRFDDTLIGMDQTLKAVHASPSFQKIVFDIPQTDENYFSMHPIETAEASSILMSYLTTKDRNSMFTFVSQHNDYLQVRNTVEKTIKLDKDKVGEMPQVIQGLQTSLYQTYYPPHLNQWTAVPEYVFSVVRPIRDTFQTYGVLEYQKNIKDFETIISASAITDLEQFALLDEAGNCLYSVHNPAPSYHEKEGFLKEIGTKEQGLYYLNTRTLLCFIRSPLTGWVIAIERDISVQLESITQFSLVIILFYFLALCILLLFLYAFTNNITQPLRELKNNLSTLEMNQDIELPQSGNHNEVAILTTAIEEILNKLRLQSTQLVNARQLTVQAHLEAMEAQLNPHFLYNTLSVIGAYSAEEGNKTVPRMCIELSNLLRYSIANHYKTVSLQKELDHIRSYLYIMKMRYEHRLEYTWDLDERVAEEAVPKLILQPLIENCFHHGFLNVLDQWRIEIQTRYEDGYWYMSVSNNGNVFSEEKLDKLKRRIGEFQQLMESGAAVETATEKLGIGLENTILRLHIYYEGKEHFKVYTNEKGDTTIEIGGVINEQPEDKDFVSGR